MPDITPPQIASAQAPVKAAGKAADAKPESESNQGFSTVLKKQLPAEAGAKEAVTAEAGRARAPSAAQAGEQPDGKTLPLTGNAEDALVAALIGAGPASTEMQEPAPATELPVDSGVLSSPDTLVTQAVSLPTIMQQSLGQAVSQSGAQPAVVPQLPGSGPSLVAQAVQEALSDLDSRTPRALPLERLGSEIRTLAAGSQRPPGFELLLERAAPNAVQNQTTTSISHALQGGLAADAPATARPVLPTTTVETPFRQPGWDQALSERVLWASNQKLQSAEIKLSPPQLGPIEVRVQMHQDQAQVSFTAQHASVREALEAALPRLREMFNASGFDLVDVNVSQHSFAEQQRQMQGSVASSHNGGQRADEGEPAVLAQELGRVGALPRGGVDLFA